MKVLYLAAEATPLVKVGGLADVAGELPRALVRLGLDIRVAMPLHAGIDRSAYGLEEQSRFPVERGNGSVEATVSALDIGGVSFWLLDGDPIRAVPGVYGQPEQDGEKYVFSAKAALLACQACGWQPDIIHANDWHAAAAINFIRSWRDDIPAWSGIRSLLTIHNLAYMGSEKARSIYAVPETSDPLLPGWAERLPLPSGIALADAINTVSPTYAQEIQTPEYGCGLEHLLAARRDRLSGIMNGIDRTQWNPEADSALDQPFSPETLELRSRNKDRLQRELGLPPKAAPLIGMITRLDHQKGVDLALEALEGLLDREWQFVLLGTGDPALEALAREFANQHPERVRALLRFDDRAARRLYGSADLILVPSRYEPCGLAQLIGMRYGAVPVVRATGGLRDSVLDVDQTPEGTGFVFAAVAPEDLRAAIHRALGVFEDKRRWRSIQQLGMKRDHSWERTAVAYAELYALRIHEAI